MSTPRNKIVVKIPFGCQPSCLIITVCLMQKNHSCTDDMWTDLALIISVLTRSIAFDKLKYLTVHSMELIPLDITMQFLQVEILCQKYLASQCNHCQSLTCYCYTNWTEFYRFTNRYMFLVFASFFVVDWK